MGFRPFVYRIARANNLYGHVANSPAGVVIEVCGTSADVEHFCHQLRADIPPLAQIDSITIEKVDAIDHQQDFRIVTSTSDCVTDTLVPVDISVCADCRRELSDPDNRRYQYPLNNCTNCGPRYTIIRDLPYDRPATALSSFPLCDECRTEYEDPGNRRFHAEAMACPLCGPQLTVTTAGGETVETDQPLDDIAARIHQGQIVGIKGVGGFHIVCDAGNSAAVALLRRRKRRPHKPFAVMVRDETMAEQFGQIDEHCRTLLTSPKRPVVLVPDRGRLPLEVHGELDRIGLILPYTPLHLLLFEFLDCPLIATSANIADEPIITDAKILRERLGAVVDAVLDVNREIINGCDDSVVTHAAGQTLMLRRARGYAPAAIMLPAALPQRVLAVGAGLKNTIALGFGAQAVLSPHIGDLDSVAAESYFQRTIATFKQLYDFEPELILCDKHPDYPSSRWALQQSVAVQQVQHHHAHALSAMVACGMGLDTEILAFCWDGTGYGDDGTLWGGEVLQTSYRHYQRRYHLRPVLLLGGEQAIREPRRVALSLLFDYYGEQALHLDNPCIHSFSCDELKLLLQMHHQRLNAPLSSSVGRMFDAAASLLGICNKMTFEGQSGMLMEKYYDSSLDLCYGFTLVDDMIDLQPTVAALLQERDRIRGVTGFINMLVALAMTIMAREGRDEALLTGGVFQNSRLVAALLKQARRRGLQLHIPQQVPMNDGGIALGQVAAALLRKN
ncbi:MAG: carbamoyltransferase HypF [Desulfuromonadales bacterium]|nr:carbamoyltransferase HypF [Desulfuromonadales bacterium]